MNYARHMSWIIHQIWDKISNNVKFDLWFALVDHLPAKKQPPRRCQRRCGCIRGTESEVPPRGGRNTETNAEGGGPNRWRCPPVVVVGGGVVVVASKIESRDTASEVGWCFPTKWKANGSGHRDLSTVLRSQTAGHHHPWSSFEGKRPRNPWGLVFPN